MLSGGDVFCFMGDHWRMLGGRWVDPKVKQAFFSYIKSGWPDSNTLKWDIDTIFDLAVFEIVSDFAPKTDYNTAKNPLWLNKFKEQVLKTCCDLEQQKTSGDVINSL
jgi:hypothetical protein